MERTDEERPTFDVWCAPDIPISCVAIAEPRKWKNSKIRPWGWHISWCGGEKNPNGNWTPLLVHGHPAPLGMFPKNESLCPKLYPALDGLEMCYEDAFAEKYATIETDSFSAKFPNLYATSSKQDSLAMRRMLDKAARTGTPKSLLRTMLTEARRRETTRKTKSKERRRRTENPETRSPSRTTVELTLPEGVRVHKMTTAQSHNILVGEATNDTVFPHALETDGYFFTVGGRGTSNLPVWEGLGNCFLALISWEETDDDMPPRRWGMYAYIVNAPGVHYWLTPFAVETLRSPVLKIGLTAATMFMTRHPDRLRRVFETLERGRGDVESVREAEKIARVALRRELETLAEEELFVDDDMELLFDMEPAPTRTRTSGSSSGRFDKWVKDVFVQMPPDRVIEEREEYEKLQKQAPEEAEDEDRLCAVCNLPRVGKPWSCIPCGHTKTCLLCILKHGSACCKNRTDVKCPICSTKIANVTKIWL